MDWIKVIVGGIIGGSTAIIIPLILYLLMAGSISVLGAICIGGAGFLIVFLGLAYLYPKLKNK